MICGLTLARNESWIIAYSARVSLTWVDHLIILCHACEDTTFDIASEIATEHPGRVTVMTESDHLFNEMDFRQKMLEKARELGGTVIATCDADEIVSANIIPGIRKRCQMLPPGGVLVTPIHNLWRSLDRYRNDESAYGGGRLVLAFRDAPGVAWRPADDGYQFHQRLPLGPWLSPLRYPPEREMGGVMHCQHASWRRLTAKQAFYKLQEVIRWPHRDRAEIDALYSACVDETDAQLYDVPSAWWNHGLDRSLINADAEPWQEVALKSIIAQYGAEAFADLDLFGVI